MNFSFVSVCISASQWVECSPMVRETWVQSPVESYQRLLKWYLIPPCLTLIRYVSRGKWSSPGKEVATSPTSQCSSYWKGSLLVALDYGRQLYLLFTVLLSFTVILWKYRLIQTTTYIYIYIYVCIYMCVCVYVCVCVCSTILKRVDIDLFQFVCCTLSISVIVEGNGISGPSSNPVCISICVNALKIHESICSAHSYEKKWFFSPGLETNKGKRKLKSCYVYSD